MNAKMTDRKLLILGLILITIGLLTFANGYVFAAQVVDAERISLGAIKAAMMKDGHKALGAIASVFELTSDDTFEVLRRQIDKNGSVHTRYRQKFRNIPIWGLQMIVHEDKDGNIQRTTGHLLKSLDKSFISAKSLQPAKSVEDVLSLSKAITLKDIRKTESDVIFQNEKVELVIFLTEKNEPILSYSIDFFADSKAGGSPTRPHFLIDANSGKVIKKWEGLTNASGTGPGGNQKAGSYEYGTNYGYLDVSQNGSTCTMENTNVRTINLDHGTSGSSPFSYTCYRNTFQQINGAYSPINDAHYFGKVVYNMYQNLYDTSPLPFQLKMCVHYKTSYENAFWNGSEMYFGDGDTTFYPFVSLDVVSHEVSHGFTENNSGLIYSGQSGGINEAFSDMAGEAAEYYMHGSNDWKVGADIYKAADQALRYMYNPPLDGYSIDNAAAYNDGLDVHYSSGVFNKAFYLLATKPGWNTRKAFGVMVKANRDYWIPASTFVIASCGAINAAIDLNYNDIDVYESFLSVGVKCDSYQPPPLIEDLVPIIDYLLNE